MGTVFSRAGVLLLATSMVGLILAAPQRAEACGCFSPPVVNNVDTDEYAVNQESEQIIFEVEDGTVTAHVLILFEGKADSFAWTIPVPNVPEFGLSETLAFGLLNNGTEPVVRAGNTSLCPDPFYVCDRHAFPSCPSDDGDDIFADSPSPSPENQDAGAQDPGAGGGAPGIDVLARETIGDYEIVVFAAEEATTAVTWLRDEGFMVNETTTPFMQPYLDENMAFVAAKLIPGADVREIRPLKMTYQADQPMIPLRLTAVGANPHLTVTSFIYSDTAYEPDDHPSIAILDRDLTTDADGRNNYPMVLARAVDTAGGDGFVTEYAGGPFIPTFGMGSGCCDDDSDRCFVGGDTVCQCPNQAFDADDCSSEAGLVEGIELLNDLAGRHTHLTRITTRISDYEMTFDPMFRPTDEAPLSGRLELNATRYNMQRCTDDIIDTDRFEAAAELDGCSTTYCGEGTCVATADGPACQCDAGFTARQFPDLDGRPSVTCVPDEAPVNYGAGGVELPSSCRGITCGRGNCVDLSGFPTCRCDAGNAARVVDGSAVPTCDTITRITDGPGAENMSALLQEVRACAPEPPTDCGEFGWLTDNDNIRIEGVLCPSSVPEDDSLFVIPAERPTCDDAANGIPGRNPGGDPTDDPGFMNTEGESEGCSIAYGTRPGASFAFIVAALGLFVMRRRR